MKHKQRRDLLPEFYRYRDDGCKEVAPRCVECPLVVCRYEIAGGLRAIHNMQRDSTIRAARRFFPAEVIAAHLGVSRRTVFRVVASQ